MKKLAVIIAVLLPLGLLVIGLKLGPYHPHPFIVMPAPYDPPAYVMPTLENAQTLGETAIGVRWAILAGDFAGAEQAVEAELAKDNPESDDVFNFLALIIPRNNPAFPTALTNWIKQDASSPLPYMLRAYYYYDTGLLFRGSGFVNEIPAERMAIFATYINLARSDLEHVRAGGDHSPWLYCMLMQIAQFTGDPVEENGIFNEAVKYNPHYYPLYALRLSELTPKWGGSLMEMGQFASHYYKASPKHPRFQMLSLEMYFDLLRDRRVNCSYTGPVAGDCYQAMNEFLLSAPVQKQIGEVITSYAKSDLYTLNKEITYDFCFCAFDNATYEKPLVDMLAQAGGDNNYAVDYLRSEMTSFYGKDNRAALVLGRKALAEAQSFRFPTESDRKATLAELNEALYQANLDLQDFPEAIRYAMASVANDRTSAHYQAELCTAYFRQGQLNEAIVNCNASLALRDNSYARDMRADAYINKQMPDNAAEDLRAELSYNDIYKPEDRNRILSMLGFIYKANKRYKDELKLYADYPEMFAEKAPDLARRYGDRCEAYLGVGNLPQALADCDASLKIEYNHDVATKRTAVQEAMEHKPAEATAPPVTLIAAIDAHQDDLAKKLIEMAEEEKTKKPSVVPDLFMEQLRISMAQYMGKPVKEITPEEIIAAADIYKGGAYGHTPLMEALDKADWPIAALLIEHHADSSHPTDDEGQDALFHAVVSYCGMAWYMCPEHSDNPESLGLIGSLLKGGASPTQGTKNGRAAFTTAAFLCEVPVVKMMLDQGISINFKEGFSSLTALQSAATSCGPDMITMLLKYQPDLSIRTSRGDTALDLANKRISKVGPYDVAQVISVLKSAYGQ